MTCKRLANAFRRSGINASGFAHKIDGSPTPLVMVRINCVMTRSKWGTKSPAGHLEVFERLTIGSSNF